MIVRAAPGSNIDVDTLVAFTLLGALVNPWFLLLAGFVGAGLMFAGATGTCGLAKVGACGLAGAGACGLANVGAGGLANAGGAPAPRRWGGCASPPAPG